MDVTAGSGSRGEEPVAQLAVPVLGCFPNKFGKLCVVSMPQILICGIWRAADEVLGLVKSSWKSSYHSTHYLQIYELAPSYTLALNPDHLDKRTSPVFPASFTRDGLDAARWFRSVGAKASPQSPARVVDEVISMLTTTPAWLLHVSARTSI